MKQQTHDADVAIFGLGYVGLTLGAVMAEAGLKIIGIEPRKRSIKALKKGKSPIHEQGLEPLLNKHKNNRFRFFEKPDNIRARTYIVAVGTPVDDEKKIPKLDYVETVAHTIGDLIKHGDLIVLRSTVPVGTTRNFFLPIVENRSGLKAGVDFYVAYAPERVVEGNAINESKTIPQIIGGLNDASAQQAAKLFRKFNPNIVPVGSLEAAEIVKLFNNTYRDVVFGFANEIALICNGFNLDPSEIIQAANKDYPRAKIPTPSPGVGGYCLTKDPFILLHSTRQSPYQPYIVFHGRMVNAMMPQHVAVKTMHFLKSVARKPLSKSKVFIMGFAFKGHPETTDMRFSPTVEVVEHLRKEKIQVVGHDPKVSRTLIQQTGAKAVKSLREGFRGADVVIIMTNHQSYRSPDVLKQAVKLNQPGLFFDPWHLHAAKDVLAKGLHYSNLGYDSHRSGGQNSFVKVH